MVMRRADQNEFLECGTLIESGGKDWVKESIKQQEVKNGHMAKGHIRRAVFFLF